MGTRHKWEVASWGTRWGYVNLDTEMADARVDLVDGRYVVTSFEGEVIGRYPTLEEAKRKASKWVKGWWANY